MTAMKRAYTLRIQAGKVAIKPYFPMLKESSPRVGFFEGEQLDCIKGGSKPNHGRSI
jgi:hypothetical protein